MLRRYLVREHDCAGEMIQPRALFGTEFTASPIRAGWHSCFRECKTSPSFVPSPNGEIIVSAKRIAALHRKLAVSLALLVFAFIHPLNPISRELCSARS
jgi:hypothetical protein